MTMKPVSAGERIEGLDACAEQRSSVWRQDIIRELICGLPLADFGARPLPMSGSHR